MVPGSIAPIIGSTVLVGGFLVAPLATLLAVGLAVWHSLETGIRRALADAAASACGHSLACPFSVSSRHWWRRQVSSSRDHAD
jgi:hypothetical protein